MGALFSYVKYTPDGIPYHTLSDFKGLQRINSGTYGIVYKGYGTVDRKNQCIAVKSFSAMDIQSDREIQILKEHSHKNIVQLYGVIWDGVKDEVTTKPIFAGYVMEYLEAGSLDNEIYNYNKKYDMDLIVLWTLQITSGLQYLHEHDIIHRDIKPKNILLATRTHVKLADFGLARNVSGSNRYTSGRMGTEHYMAPEIVGEKKEYNTQADIYSFGVTVWEIAHRKRPSEHIQVIVNSKKQLEIQIPIDSEKMDETLSIMVKRCCNISPSDRPPIKNIADGIRTYYDEILNTIVESNYNEVNQSSQGFALHNLISIFKDSLLYPRKRGTKFTHDGVPYHRLSDFKDLRRLNGGSYGIAYTGYDEKNKRDVVVKVFSHLDLYSEREVLILKTHTHPNIVELFGVIWDENTYIDQNSEEKPIYTGYVMEYMKLGSLDNEIYDGEKVYDIMMVASWIQQIASGLQYLHEQTIIHRDVKPRNVLVAAKDHVKLAEFGLARNISDRNTYTAGLIGTDYYMAPETIGMEKNYGPPADIYSFGVTIWEIIHRMHPSKHMRNMLIELPIDSSKMDEAMADLVKRSLKYNASERPSLEEFIQFKPSLDAILAKRNLILDT